MANWWEVDSESNCGSPATGRGIAYYRHSAQDRQENSIRIQQDQVREWEREHGVEIIQEFADHGRWPPQRHDLQLLRVGQQCGRRERCLSDCRRESIVIGTSGAHGGAIAQDPRQRWHI